MSICLQRRVFIAALGGAVAWPLAARAQRTEMPVIGFLSPASPDDFTNRLRAFRQGLIGDSRKCREFNRIGGASDNYAVFMRSLCNLYTDTTEEMPGS